MKAVIKALAIFLFLFSHTTIFTQPQQFTWYERNSPVTTRLNGIDGLYSFPSLFWICGNNGVILKTTNDGVTFINQTGSGIPVSINLVNVVIFDQNTVLTAGYRNDTTFVYRTSNGGTNWQSNFIQPGGYINAMVSQIAISGLSQNGFMAGNPVAGRWSLWKTSNMGFSWDSAGIYLPRAGTETGFPGSLFCVDSTIWFGTNNARIYRSTNRGRNWILLTLPGEQNPSAINFNPFNIGGYYYGDAAGSSTIQVTINSGMNWTIPVSTIPGTGRIPALGGHPGGVDYAFTDSWYIRTDNNVYHFPNFPYLNWLPQYTAPSGNFTYMSTAAFYSNSIGAVRDNGGIAFCDCQIWGAVRNLGGIIPEGYELMQNYPNPFNPATTINFSVPVKSFILLKIYNAIGAYLETIVNEELPPGNYNITWDAGKFASGIYYYRLNGGNYSETKKMVLVK